MSNYKTCAPVQTKQFNLRDLLYRSATKVVGLLLSKMQQGSENCKRDGQMLARLAADALERKDRLQEGHAHSVAIWAAKEHAKEMSNKSFWHFWAGMGTPQIVDLAMESEDLCKLLGKPSPTVLDLCRVSGADTMAKSLV